MGLLYGWGKKHIAPAQAHLPLSSLALSMAPTLPPSEESLPVNQSCPALLVTPFLMNQPQGPDGFFSGPPACPPESGPSASSPWPG